MRMKLLCWNQTASRVVPEEEESCASWGWPCWGRWCLGPVQLGQTDCRTSTATAAKCSGAVLCIASATCTVSCLHSVTVQRSPMLCRAPGSGGCCPADPWDPPASAPSPHAAALEISGTASLVPCGAGFVRCKEKLYSWQC